MSDLQLVRITHPATEKSLVVTSRGPLAPGESWKVTAYPEATTVVKQYGNWYWDPAPNTGRLHGFLNTFSRGRLWFGAHNIEADARTAIAFNNSDNGTIDGLSIVAEPLGNDRYFLKWNSTTVEWDNYGNTGDGYLFMFPDDTPGESKVFWARKEDHPADAASFIFAITPLS